MRFDETLAASSINQGSWSFSDSGKRQMSNSFEQENFNLKLRIYHLEERLAQQYPGDINELIRFNAELSTQVDMKNEAIQQRDLLLVKARNVIETLQNDIELMKASNGIKSDTERNLNQDEIRRSNLTINQLSSKLQDTEQRLKSSEDELISVKTELEDASQKLSERVAECEANREKIAKQSHVVNENIYLKGTVEKLKQQLTESQENCSSLKNNLSDCLLKLQNFDILKTRAENESSDVRAELKKVNNLHSSICDRLRVTEIASAEKQATIIELEKRLSESADNIGRLEKDLNAFSKREEALLNELHKWKSLSQSQHEDKENLQQVHQDSIDKLQRSCKAYSCTLGKLSASINSLVQCLHSLQVPSFPLHSAYSDNEHKMPYNDDDKPPHFDVDDPERADLTARWIDRKIQRIARLRSCLKLTVSNVEERWNRQFSRLELVIKSQEKSIADIAQQLTRIRQPEANKKIWSHVEERLYAVGRELDASFNQLRS